jgi:hypothetical protein
MIDRQRKSNGKKRRRSQKIELRGRRKPKDREGRYNQSERWNDTCTWLSIGRVFDSGRSAKMSVLASLDFVLAGQRLWDTDALNLDAFSAQTMREGETRPCRLIGIYPTASPNGHWRP